MNLYQYLTSLPQYHPGLKHEQLVDILVDKAKLVLLDENVSFEERIEMFSMFLGHSKLTLSFWDEFRLQIGFTIFKDTLVYAKGKIREVLVIEYEDRLPIGEVLKYHFKFSSMALPIRGTETPFKRMSICYTTIEQIEARRGKGESLSTLREKVIKCEQRILENAGGVNK